MRASSDAGQPTPEQDPPATEGSAPPRPIVRTAFTALWPDLRTALLGAVRARDGAGRRPVLVGIDGRSGSGKTDLATCLVDAVRGTGLGCSLLHLDDLYPGWSGLVAGLGPLCSGVVGPLTRARDGAYTSWDWATSQPGPRKVVPAQDVVVVEGVGVLAAACAADLDVRVWLEAPVAVRRERALDRDGEVFAPHWQEWADQEDTLLAGGPPPADVVLDTVTATARWSGPGA
jgi:hypothetical protein